MRVYLHSDNAEAAPKYTVTVSPAGDTEFHRPQDFAKRGQDADKASFPSDWVNGKGEPKQFAIDFVYGSAEVQDDVGRYMVARGIAHRSRMLRRVQQLFDAAGNAIGDVFDQHGRRILLDARD